MITLELAVTDIDFERLADRFYPELVAQLRASGHPLAGLLGGSREAAMAVLRRLPADTKEKLAVSLLNSRRSELTGILERAAETQGISLRIADAKAYKS